MDKMVVVGQVGSPHGVKGWMKLHSYTQPAENILSYKHWFLQTKEGWNPLASAQVEIVAGNNGLMRIRLAGCNTPEQARLYTNLTIGVTRDQLPVLAWGEYYWSDLQGLEVISANDNSVLGQVSHLFATGANDVLVVKGDKERLLPYITEVILEVDLKKGQIRVNWDADF